MGRGEERVKDALKRLIGFLDYKRENLSNEQKILASKLEEEMELDEKGNLKNATTDAYASAVREWAMWYKERYNDECAIITVDRVTDYLVNYIGKKQTQMGKWSGQGVSHSALNKALSGLRWLKSLKDIFRPEWYADPTRNLTLQEGGEKSIELRNCAAIRAFEDSIKRAMKNGRNPDKWEGHMVEDLTLNHISKVASIFLDINTFFVQGLRNRVGVLFGAAVANRGDNRRACELGHAGTLLLAPDGSPSERRTLLVLYLRTKTVGDHDILTGALRNERWDTCFVGSMAAFCVQRFDVMQERAEFDFIQPPYMVKTSPARCP